MATFRLRRFSCPETLRAIAPDRLAAFLRPFRDFLRGRGAPLPDPGGSSGPDYDRLVAAFMSPDRDTPKELLDALFFVDEMATREGMDTLLDAARELGLGLDARADDSPADVAVAVWLKNPHFLERKHAEHLLDRPRAFEYFQTDEPRPAPFAPRARRRCGPWSGRWTTGSRRSGAAAAHGSSSSSGRTPRG
jgi:hypothetical protein